VLNRQLLHILPALALTAIRVVITPAAKVAASLRTRSRCVAQDRRLRRIGLAGLVIALLLTLPSTAQALSWSPAAPKRDPHPPCFAPPPRHRPKPSSDCSSQVTGLASWYGRPYHGRRTASGEIFDMNALTAARATLPMNSWVRIINLCNDRVVIARINDRGPYVAGRVIDLSAKAAELLDFKARGLVPVRIELIDARP